MLFFTKAKPDNTEWPPAQSPQGGSDTTERLRRGLVNKRFKAARVTFTLNSGRAIRFLE